MASQTIVQASIAELYDEAAQARELASKYHDAAARRDLVAYATALEAAAARWERALLSKTAGETPDWESALSDLGDRARPTPRRPQIWGNARRGHRM